MEQRRLQNVTKHKSYEMLSTIANCSYDNSSCSVCKRPSRRDISNPGYWNRVRSLSRDNRSRMEARENQMKMAEVEEMKRREEILSLRKKERDTLTNLYLRAPIQSYKPDLIHGLDRSQKKAFSRSVPDLEEAYRTMQQAQREKLATERKSNSAWMSDQRSPITTSQNTRLKRAKQLSVSTGNLEVPKSAVRDSQKAYPTRPKEELEARLNILQKPVAKLPENYPAVTKVKEDKTTDKKINRTSTNFENSKLVLISKPNLDRRPSMPNLEGLKFIRSSQVYESITNLGELEGVNKVMILPSTSQNPSFFKESLENTSINQSSDILPYKSCHSSGQRNSTKPAKNSIQSRKKDWIAKQFSSKTGLKTILNKNKNGSSNKNALQPPKVLDMLPINDCSFDSEGNESVYYDSLEEDNFELRKKRRRSFFVPLSENSIKEFTLPPRLTERMESIQKWNAHNSPNSPSSREKSVGRHHKDVASINNIPTIVAEDNPSEKLFNLVNRIQDDISELNEQEKDDIDLSSSGMSSSSIVSQNYASSVQHTDDLTFTVNSKHVVYDKSDNFKVSPKQNVEKNDHSDSFSNDRTFEIESLNSNSSLSDAKELSKTCSVDACSEGPNVCISEFAENNADECLIADMLIYYDAKYELDQSTPFHLTSDNHLPSDLGTGVKEITGIATGETESLLESGLGEELTSETDPDLGQDRNPRVMAEKKNSNNTAKNNDELNAKKQMYPKTKKYCKEYKNKSGTAKSAVTKKEENTKPLEYSNVTDIKSSQGTCSSIEIPPGENMLCEKMYDFFHQNSGVENSFITTPTIINDQRITTVSKTEWEKATSDSDSNDQEGFVIVQCPGQEEQQQESIYNQHNIWNHNMLMNAMINSVFEPLIGLAIYAESKGFLHNQLTNLPIEKLRDWRMLQNLYPVSTGDGDALSEEDSVRPNTHMLSKYIPCHYSDKKQYLQVPTPIYDVEFTNHILRNSWHCDTRPINVFKDQNHNSLGLKYFSSASNDYRSKMYHTSNDSNAVIAQPRRYSISTLPGSKIQDIIPLSPTSDLSTIEEETECSTEDSRSKKSSISLGEKLVQLDTFIMDECASPLTSTDQSVDDNKYVNFHSSNDSRGNKNEQIITKKRPKKGSTVIGKSGPLRQEKLPKSEEVESGKVSTCGHKNNSKCKNSHIINAKCKMKQGDVDDAESSESYPSDLSDSDILDSPIDTAVENTSFEAESNGTSSSLSLISLTDSEELFLYEDISDVKSNSNSFKECKKDDNDESNINQRRPSLAEILKQKVENKKKNDTLQKDTTNQIVTKLRNKRNILRESKTNKTKVPKCLNSTIPSTLKKDSNKCSLTAGNYLDRALDSDNDNCRETSQEVGLGTVSIVLGENNQATDENMSRLSVPKESHMVKKLPLKQECSLEDTTEKKWGKGRKSQKILQPEHIHSTVGSEKFTQNPAPYSFSKKLRQSENILSEIEIQKEQLHGVESESFDTTSENGNESIDSQEEVFMEDICEELSLIADRAEGGTCSNDSKSNSSSSDSGIVEVNAVFTNSNNDDCSPVENAKSNNDEANINGDFKDNTNYSLICPSNGELPNSPMLSNTEILSTEYRHNSIGESTSDTIEIGNRQTLQRSFSDSGKSYDNTDHITRLFKTFETRRQKRHLSRPSSIDECHLTGDRFKPPSLSTLDSYISKQSSSESTDSISQINEKLEEFMVEIVAGEQKYNLPLSSESHINLLIRILSQDKKEPKTCANGKTVVSDPIANISTWDTDYLKVKGINRAFRQRLSRKSGACSNRRVSIGEISIIGNNIEKCFGSPSTERRRPRLNTDHKVPPICLLRTPADHCSTEASKMEKSMKAIKAILDNLH